MTKAEWTRLALLIDGLWKDDFDNTRQGSYFTVLSPYDAIDVYAAVMEWTDEDRPFAPSIGELKSRLKVSANPSQVPSYDRAMVSLNEVSQRCGIRGEKQGLRSLAQEAPFLAVFAKRVGWAFLVYRRGQDTTFTRQVYDAVVEECAARREVYLESLPGARKMLGLPEGS